MFGPGKHTEKDALLGFLDQQLAGIRAAAHGLTEEQARTTPCRSTLSVGGLVKHVTYVLQGRLSLPDDPAAMPDEAGYALFMGSFVLAADETLAGVLTEFDAAHATFLAGVRATDPGADVTAPPAPWDGIYAPTASVQRYELLHLLEELARHAGHADIVREQVDGATAAPLLMAVEGREGNDFVQPWVPA